MGVTENEFQWSAASFLLGLSISNFVATIGQCVLLFYRRRSRFYLALLVVATCSALDPMCTYIGASRIATDGWQYNVGSCLVSLFGLGMFGTLNFVRFYKTCGKSYPRLSRVLAVGTAIHLIVFWVINIWWAVFSFSRRPFSDAADLFFAYSLWYIYDALLNVAVSLAFVLFLRSRLAGGQMAGQVVLRRGIQRALMTVQVSLAVECLFLLTNNIMNAVDATIDPLWGLSYLGNSIRVRVFCTFLDTIRRLMSENTHAGTGMTDSSTGTATGGGGGNGPRATMISTSPSSIVKQHLVSSPSVTGMVTYTSTSNKPIQSTRRAMMDEDAG
ncbi:hypothetical protein AMAG_06580 [Allomyces macrogynus ATCC 38327]|uniref:G-protein coupled receptors family 1 profile domain-containing protein n=1 Tax=Allomyces macrogynus (strain ATCC 38327) TaxID=578462 RepID=A0A0L0SH57_ALLM3|nr:hypothetical protein AMAG_06580 [Allomyces macrogynus ATCC 38327]|eukprot:KNE61782.1 hypothetical protein AMAG_06580 [Allomyces macrogynus ATCC 38327]